MAGNKNKKPKHTRLVLPGDNDDKEPAFSFFKKDRLGRKVATEEVVAEESEQEETVAVPPLKKQAPQKKQTPKKQQPASKKVPPTPKAEPEELPANAIRMPQGKEAEKKSARYIAAKRKKNRRRLRVGAVLLLTLTVAWSYFSGAYAVVLLSMGDVYDSVRVAVQPGDGFPMDLMVSGFEDAEPMGAGGFVALGDKDMAIVTASGRESNRIQHGYVYPAMTAGNNRVCVYNRGTQDFTVVSRSSTITRSKVQNGEILFAEMSPNGWLAVVTNSRFRANLQVYNTTYDMNAPEFSWALTDDRPILAAFHPDNRNLALGCLTVKDGALNSTIYLLKTNKKDIQASIFVPDSRILKASFVGGGDLLVVFDTHVALYSLKGEEKTRYNFGKNKLQTADINDGQVALVFGGGSRDTLRLVMLSTELQPLFEAVAANVLEPAVLVQPDGAYLLLGQEVLAYSTTGILVDSMVVESKTLGMVEGGQPLLLTANQALPLEQLIAPASSAPEKSPTSSTAVSGGLAAESETANMAPDSDAPESTVSRQEDS